jgi:fluoroacetyl-CoA thioesterase
MDFKAGLTGRVELVVGDGDTARALGSGDVAVLGTPRVVALAEAATAAVVDHVHPEQTTVGTRVVLDHLAATPVGRTVVAEATLNDVAGRRLTFAVTVHDGDTVAASGTVERVVVDRDRFQQRAGA